jgi:hypothetical protein
MRYTGGAAGDIIQTRQRGTVDILAPASLSTHSAPPSTGTLLMLAKQVPTTRAGHD